MAKEEWVLGEPENTQTVYEWVLGEPAVSLDATGAPPVGAAVPVISKDGVHSLVFGGQIITG
jgi:hypothetical protein